MSAITLEAIESRQSELNKMIQQFKTQTSSRQIVVEECTIELRPGEHYAGPVLDENGQLKHHLVLLADRPTKDVNWNDAVEWAQSVGGSLPDRQEQALLYANCKPHLQPRWHWSSVVYEDDASYAWLCGFNDGDQDSLLKSYEGSAVAVRRVLPL